MSVAILVLALLVIAWALWQLREWEREERQEWGRSEPPE